MGILKAPCGGFVLLLTGGLSRTHETWLMKHLQFKVLALRSLVAICIGGGVGIVMAVNGYGLLSLIAQQLITSVIGTVCLWLVTTWRPGFDTRWENIASLLRYSRHLSLAAVAAFADGQSDVFFSSWYLGPAATGVYNAAKRT
jgi:lipopolysaccharide exporter